MKAIRTIIRAIIFIDEKFKMNEVELVSKISLFFPGFKKRWNKKRSMYIRLDNTVTSCSIWSDLIHYLNNQWKNLSQEQKADFFYSLDLCFTSGGCDGIFDTGNDVVGGDDSVNGSLQVIQTCFLENLIHSSLYNEASAYFGENTSRFVEKWNVEHE